MKQHRKFSWRERAKSFKFAAQGIITLLRDEHNARIHLAAAIIAVILGFICKISPTQWAVIAILIAAVFALEAINSAIEALADKISPQADPLIKKAKDTAAAAVLFMAFAAIVTALCFFLKPFLSLCM